jgi:hypothetical protein
VPLVVDMVVGGRRVCVCEAISGTRLGHTVEKVGKLSSRSKRCGKGRGVGYEESKSSKADESSINEQWKDVSYALCGSWKATVITFWSPHC